MTTCDYIFRMDAALLSGGVREIKTAFSEYIRNVENGASVLVTNRGKVVAEIRPYTGTAPLNSNVEFIWASKGKLRVPAPVSEKKKPLPVSFLKSDAETVRSLIDEERAE